MIQADRPPIASSNPGGRSGVRRGPRGRFHGRRRGAAAVELALVAPLLVLLLLGIAEFGSMFYVRQTLVHAARSGARELAIQGATEEEAITTAEDFLSTANVTGAVITAQNAYAGSGDDAAAREVWVEIVLPTQNALILGDALDLFPAGSNITVRATLRKEGELLTAPTS